MKNDLCLTSLERERDTLAKIMSRLKPLSVSLCLYSLAVTIFFSIPFFFAERELRSVNNALEVHDSLYTTFGDDINVGQVALPQINALRVELVSIAKDIYALETSDKSQTLYGRLRQNLESSAAKYKHLISEVCSRGLANLLATTLFTEAREFRRETPLIPSPSNIGLAAVPWIPKIASESASEQIASYWMLAGTLDQFSHASRRLNRILFEKTQNTADGFRVVNYRYMELGRLVERIDILVDKLVQKMIDHTTLMVGPVEEQRRSYQEEWDDIIGEANHIRERILDDATMFTLLRTDHQDVWECFYQKLPTNYSSVSAKGELNDINEARVFALSVSSKVGRYINDTDYYLRQLGGEFNGMIRALPNERKEHDSVIASGIVTRDSLIERRETLLAQLKEIKTPIGDVTNLNGVFILLIPLTMFIMCCYQIKLALRAIQTASLIKCGERQEMAQMDSKSSAGVTGITDVLGLDMPWVNGMLMMLAIVVPVLAATGAAVMLYLAWSVLIADSLGTLGALVAFGCMVFIGGWAIGGAWAALRGIVRFHLL